jgi:hypothetical protein
MELTTRDSIWPGKRRVSYSARIIAFCTEHGVVVPSGFHSRSAYKIAVIDITAIPHKLIAATWYLPASVEAYLSSAGATGREFRILNFKTGRELQAGPNGKLQSGNPFNCRKDADVIY